MLKPSSVSFLLTRSWRSSSVPNLVCFLFLCPFFHRCHFNIGPKGVSKKNEERQLADVVLCDLGSLCCDTAEEAKTLVPSLQDKISDDELQELLDEITKLMGYGN